MLLTVVAPSNNPKLKTFFDYRYYRSCLKLQQFIHLVYDTVNGLVLDTVYDIRYKLSYDTQNNSPDSAVFRKWYCTQAVFEVRFYLKVGPFIPR